ncbi:hypothetical protein RHCRD62_80037 [Rhodococcus sp. RD6.2]|nr:hypothetical protein RHCRD62_80037 [Rhodococcus sp. RD6.2]
MTVAAFVTAVAMNTFQHTFGE